MISVLLAVAASSVQFDIDSSKVTRPSSGAAHVARASEPVVARISGPVSLSIDLSFAQEVASVDAQHQSLWTVWQHADQRYRLMVVAHPNKFSPLADQMRKLSEYSEGEAAGTPVFYWFSKADKVQGSRVFYIMEKQGYIVAGMLWAETGTPTEALLMGEFKNLLTKWKWE
jgi:hypothetical protein